VSPSPRHNPWVTSASSSTASCRCRLTSLRSVKAATQLRQLRQAVGSLSASKTLVQVFVSCYLDYCNSLFFSISEGLMSRLQSFRTPPLGWLLVLGVATTLTLVLRLLHWLPVRLWYRTPACLKTTISTPSLLLNHNWNMNHHFGAICSQSPCSPCTIPTTKWTLNMDNH